MGQLDTAAQHAAAASEELASTSNEMISHVDGLRNKIDFFQLKETDEKARANKSSLNKPKLNSKTNTKTKSIDKTTSIPDKTKATKINKPQDIVVKRAIRNSSAENDAVLDGSEVKRTDSRGSDVNKKNDSEVEKISNGNESQHFSVSNSTAVEVDEDDFVRFD